MIKRFLTVSGVTLLLAGSILLSSASVRAADVPDNPGGGCASLNCWQM